MGRIQDARVSAHLSRRAASDFLGIPQRTLKSWESGERVPPDYVERFVVEKLDSLRCGLGVDEVDGNGRLNKIFDDIVKSLVVCGVIQDENRVLVRKIISDRFEKEV